MSELRATTVSNLAGTGPVELTGQSAAKAFSTINYTAGVPALSKNFNISSITDAGTGQVTHSFGNNFSDANYAVTMCSRTSVANRYANVNDTSAPTTSSFVGLSVATTGAVDDDFYTSVFGDLA